MKSQNKRMKQWKYIRDTKIIPMFREKEIESCELILNRKCTGTLFTGFAHRHNRSWYYRNPKLLEDFKHVILCCVECHAILDRNKDFREKKFKKLREEI